MRVTSKLRRDATPQAKIVCKMLQTIMSTTIATDVLTSTPKHPLAHFILAHGAGAPMDSAVMDALSTLLMSADIAVTRFEFSYMAERRQTGKKRPPPAIDKLTLEYEAIVTHLRPSLPQDIPLLIGGKSMGGRVASLIADKLFAEQIISGLVCLGYPFHPAGKPEKLRTQHLQDLQTPTLIVQGTRDALGDEADVGTYQLSSNIHMSWLGDGDHDFKPRKKSGLTHEENLQSAASAVRQFVNDLTP